MVSLLFNFFTMKKTLFLILLSFYIINGNAQTYFNRVYRLDTRQGNATFYKSLRVVNNTIYMAGVGVFNVK